MGNGLSACLTTACSNPQLRVAAGVYVLQKNGELKFSSEALMSHNDPVVTDHCSPFQVTWDVKTTCDTLDIDDFSKWCGHNKYNDHHAHGVRELVTPEGLLSKIK